MTRVQVPVALRHWRAFAAVVAIGALVGGGGLLAAASDSSDGQAFHPVISTRVLDTRDVGGAPLGSNTTLDVTVPGLPDDATAVAVNLTVTDGSQASYLTLYSTLRARPLTSSINWASPAAVANSAIIAIGADHSIRAFNYRGTVNVVIDMLGYYAPAPSGSGAPGAAGPQGMAGPQGATGGAGSQGVKGDIGATGLQGAEGDTGPLGPQGVKGDAGAPGSQGLKGDTGATGPQGPQGPQGVKGDAGVTGLPGPQGENAAASVYVYAYNTVAQPVMAGDPISFNKSRPSADFAFLAPGSAFVVPIAGVYRVSFSVTGDSSNQFSIRRNGQNPAEGPLIFGSRAGYNPTVGSAELTLIGGDSITLANLSSGSGAGNVMLEANLGGTGAAINAWIRIELVND